MYYQLIFYHFNTVGGIVMQIIQEKFLSAYGIYQHIRYS